LRYAFILAHKDEFTISTMCRVLKVSRSGLYAKHNRPLSLRSRNDLEVREKLIQLHQTHRQAPGIIKTWCLLNAERDVCGRNKIARLRKLEGLQTLRSKRHWQKRVHQKVEPPAPDLVQREFKVSKMNAVWVGDMTFIRTRNGALWLSVFIDLYTHLVTGWAIAPTATAKLAIDTLQKGINAKAPPAGMICHTDQGSTYGATEYRELLELGGIRPSMSRKGNCHDNAVAESFFSTLKNELTHHYIYDDIASAEAAIGEYIEVYYNKQRLHQSLNYRTPAQMESLSGAP
jgi:putative transposase